jgi:cytochrome c biogenesis protein
MKAIIKFFNSVRLAIVLLIILAVASVLGTLIPQQRTLEEYAARYGQLSTLLVRLQFTQLYHSVWYIAALALLALNLITCTLTRLSPKLRRIFTPHIESDAKNILALRTKDHFKKNAPLSAVKSELEKLLASSHYRIRPSAKESKIHILARKRFWGLLGSDVVHVGLLIILAGGIISGLRSFRTELALNEGDVRPVPKANFELRLEKFATEYYPDGSVKDWKSTLTVIDQEKPVLTRTVEVNHPLAYRGFSFYQTSYGWNWDGTAIEILAKKKSDAAFSRTFKLKVGERGILDDKEDTTISVARFIPDFVLGERNEPETRSLQPNNPAALIEGLRGNEKLFSGWIFAHYPDFGQMHGAKETDLAFELKNFVAGQYSVIEAARDPGVNLIWIGCILLMAGLGIAFYWPPWEMKILLEESQGKTDVIAGGIAAKSRERFDKEFGNIMAALRRSK